MSKQKVSRAAKVAARDGSQCHYCGTELTIKQQTVDHKRPKAKGGTNALDNLVLSCHPCNQDKGNMKYERYWRFLHYRQLGFSRTSAKWLSADNAPTDASVIARLVDWTERTQNTEPQQRSA